MKTLDDVIDDFEKACDLERRCANCSGCLGQEYGCPNDGAESVPDALKYLKKLKRIEAKIERIALGNIEDTLSKIDNPPLTWDELREMEGKPVWIDSIPLVRRWVIIKKFHPIGGNKNLFDMEVEDGAHFLRKNMRRDDPAWWQAYRKERE